MRTIAQILQDSKTIAIVGLSNKPERASLGVVNTCKGRATASSR